MPDRNVRLEPPHAVAILRKDHLRLTQVFIDYFAARETRRYDLIPFICETVKRHMALDAEIFFPYLARTIGDERLASSAVAEYTAVKHFIEELLHPDPGDFAISERVYRLATMVQRHIRTSESPDGTFAKALCSNMDGAAVGSLLRRRQRAWMLETRDTY